MKVIGFTVLESVYAKDDPAALDATLESIARSTCLPEAVVLVKDGTIPDSLEGIIGTWQSGERLRLVVVGYAQNKGLAHALSYGLQFVRTELVARMDSDDICVPDRFERQVAFMDSHPEIAISSGYIEEFETDPQRPVSTRRVPLTSEAIHRYLKRRSPFNHVAVMFRKSAVLAAGLVPPVKPASARTNLPKSAQISMWLFILGVAFAVTGGFIPAVRTPLGMAKPMSMSVFLQLCMFATSLLILLVCKPKLNDAMNSPVMKAGITAVICVFGLAWMGDTFIKAHSAEWVKDLGVYVQQAPWLLAFAFFFGSSLLNSQAATVRALYPLGFALGLPAPMILGMFPACLGTSFFPTSGVIVACINYDQSGTTRIGKYVLNHSFMLSVIVTTGISTVLGIVFAQLFL